MAKPFIERLRKYYESVAAVLRGEADAASVFPNTTDIGMTREAAYAEFLRQHAPSKCDVFLGGFVFDEDGNESRQLDIIITTDTAPQYKFRGTNKSFSPVEGTLGVVSVKSTLNKTELYDALEGLASIPLTRSLADRSYIQIRNYDDWPIKIVFASTGIAPETLMNHVADFYTEHPEIPEHRRVNYIHVAGNCVITRMQEGMSLTNPLTGIVTKANKGEFMIETDNPDLVAINWTLHDLQQAASASTHILYSYGNLLNRVLIKRPDSETTG